MNRRGFLKACFGGVVAITAAPLANLPTEASIGDFDSTTACRNTSGVGPQITHPYLPDSELGSLCMTRDRRIYRLRSEWDIRLMRYNSRMAFDANGCPLGLIVSRPSPGKVWLMVNSGPYTVNWEVA